MNKKCKENRSNCVNEFSIKNTNGKIIVVQGIDAALGLAVKWCQHEIRWHSGIIITRDEMLNQNRANFWRRLIKEMS